MIKSRILKKFLVDLTAEKTKGRKSRDNVPSMEVLYLERFTLIGFYITL
jgi:hypothetical protein